jgi:tRNA pseudouridine32 synthase/23S rRNA pseudouridine746 synthase
VGRHEWRQSLLHYRKALSEALQLWLFRQYRMLNCRGERKDLVDIWRDYHSSPKLLGKFPLPPGGTGDCCAPKLLQYAYEHHLRPLYIAEFWYGQSPRGEVRHHGHFYPACRGKCLPVLSFMLQGLEVEEGAAEAARNRQLEQELQILYSDSSLLVVVKPSGLLSVPGRIAAPSLQELLSAQYGQVFMPHRLDMDTSGLMVVARTADAYRHLQQQFYARTIYKRYTALLDGHLPVGQCGTIDLPLRPDPLDRPRQVVDRLHGKQAVTDYEVLPLPAGFSALNDEGTVAFVSLKPHTGRTHQLRLHCAHHDGLGLPIVGDCLYGKRPFHRLCLHAAELAFTHPLTNERLHFCTEPKFLS